MTKRKHRDFDIFDINLNLCKYNCKRRSSKSSLHNFQIVQSIDLRIINEFIIILGNMHK